MEKIPFREFHLLELLDGYEEKQQPLDLFISFYFRSHPALGSKDRGFIAETAYQLVRQKRMLDFLCPRGDWEDKYEFFKTADFKALFQDSSIPLSVRLNTPDFLFQLLENDYGIELATAICLASNQPAPTTVRANTSKISRDALIEKWLPLYPVAPTILSPDGIIFQKKMNFFELSEFKEGLFEVQDEASQIAGGLVELKPGDQVLDFCAGSGGKTLAFAPKMEGKGQVYLHDIRKHALAEAKKRLKRAGVQNFQLLFSDSPHINRLKKKMDWVFVDAPCSGTGTLRRNPDMKWKFDEEMLNRLLGQQRTIFEKALSFLKPGGKIIYATCSILKAENDCQVEHFLRTYPLKIEKAPFRSFPEEGKMDGFFAATFTHSS